MASCKYVAHHLDMQWMETEEWVAWAFIVGLTLSDPIHQKAVDKELHALECVRVRLSASKLLNAQHQAFVS